ncbi:MAG: hypothetical protein AB1635_09950 [Acidobacteriota bacterium]
MMTNRFNAVAAALLGALVLAQTAPVSTQSVPGTPVPGVIVDGKPVQVISGRVRGAITLTNDRHWVLRGAVFVEDGATLNIQPGTRVVGEAGSVGTLVVLRGGRLNAIGTRENPIVFTSDQAPGRRARGDWGGLILNGRAPVNLTGGEGEGEADTGIFGGTDEDDSSGILRYVRVEFAGTEFSPDNELNGIAFQGTGRRTEVDYVQVHMSKDDGLEFFGGTTDARHVVLTNVGDDSLDWTFGWRGRMQFVVVSQRGDDADNGIEADNNEFNNELLPRANPAIYNITMCGDPDLTEGAESARGALFRRGTAVTFRNFVIQGFKVVGMEINGSSTLSQVANGTTRIDAGVLTGNLAGNAHSSVTPQVASGRFSNVRVGVDAGIGNCFDHAAPDWRPRGVATLAGGQLAPFQPPNDGFFEPVTFIGGVGPLPEHDWISGWTAFPQD